MGCIFAPAFSTATLGVKSTDAGIASAMVNTSQQVGGSVGTALLSTIFASAAAGLRIGSRQGCRTPASAASIHGYTTAFDWAAAMFGLGLLVALFDPSLRRRRARPQRPSRSTQRSPPQPGDHLTQFLSGRDRQAGVTSAFTPQETRYE